MCLESLNTVKTMVPFACLYMEKQEYASIQEYSYISRIKTPLELLS